MEDKNKKLEPEKETQVVEDFQLDDLLDECEDDEEPTDS